MNKKRLVLLVTLLLCLTSFLLGMSQSGGYDLFWWTVDGGGDTFSQGGEYSLGGTIGQPEAGVLMNGDNYTLAGGFWGGGGLAEELGINGIYLPIVLKQ